MATIRRSHDSTALFTASQASDFLYGYDLSLLSGWRGHEALAEIEELQTVLHSSWGCFEPLVAVPNPDPNPDLSLWAR